MSEADTRGADVEANPVSELSATYAPAHSGYAVLGPCRRRLPRRAPLRPSAVPADWILATDVGPVYFSIGLPIAATAMRAVTS